MRAGVRLGTAAAACLCRPSGFNRVGPNGGEEQCRSGSERQSAPKPRGRVVIGVAHYDEGSDCSRSTEFMPLRRLLQVKDPPPFRNSHPGLLALPGLERCPRGAERFLPSLRLSSVRKGLGSPGIRIALARLVQIRCMLHKSIELFACDFRCRATVFGALLSSLES